MDRKEGRKRRGDRTFELLSLNLVMLVQQCPHCYSQMAESLQGEEPQGAEERGEGEDEIETLPTNRYKLMRAKFISESLSPLVCSLLCCIGLTPVFSNTVEATTKTLIH
jgi:hypothetical protein